MRKKTVAKAKRVAPKKIPVKKRRPTTVVPTLKAEAEQPGSYKDEVCLDFELSHRLATVADKRGLTLSEVLHEAVQKYLESEFVLPTTPEKDDALYPPTEAPLEEAPLLRSEDTSRVVETPLIDVTEN